MSFLKYLLLSLIIPTSIYAGVLCENELSIVADQRTVDFSTNESQRLDFLIYRTYTYKACKYFVTFGRGSGPDYNRKLYLSYPTPAIPFQLYKDTSTPAILMNFPEVSSETNLITGNYPNYPMSTPRQHTYIATLGNVPLGTPSGYYYETLRAYLYSGTLKGGYHFETSQSITYRYYVPSSIGLSIVDTGSPYDEYSLNKSIDFGMMSSGLSKNFDIVIKSNEGYKLFFSSDNGGKLMHSSLGAYVPYTTQVNGTNMTLVPYTPIQVASGNGITPANGERLNVILTLGAITNQPAGTYSDYITVTVQSN